MMLRGILIWLIGMAIVYSVLFIRGMRVRERRKVIRRLSTFAVASLIAFIFAVVVSLTNHIQGL